MISPEVPDVLPRARGRISSTIGGWVLSSLGWKITGKLPANKKLLFAVAPHTSNWDFVIAIAAMLYLNLKVSFMGKDAIFIWPFRRLLLKLGGIPIERNSSHGVVKQMVLAYEQSEQLLLGIAPEGTRSKTKEWKTGFLRIAQQANIPIVPVSLHFDVKEICFQTPMDISEDIDVELQRVKARFASVCAKKPQAV